MGKRMIWIGLLSALFLITFSIDVSATCTIDTYTTRAAGEQINMTCDHGGGTENATQSWNWTITTLDVGVKRYWASGYQHNQSQYNTLDNITYNITHLPSGYQDQDITFTVYCYNWSQTNGTDWVPSYSDTETFAINSTTISINYDNQFSQADGTIITSQTGVVPFWVNTTTRNNKGSGEGEQIDLARLYLGGHIYTMLAYDTNETQYYYNITNFPEGAYEWYVIGEDTDGSSTSTTATRKIYFDYQGISGGGITSSQLEDILGLDGEKRKQLTWIIIIGGVIYLWYWNNKKK